MLYQNTEILPPSIFTSVYNTMKKIHKRQSSKSYYAISYILFLLLFAYKEVVLRSMGIDFNIGYATQRMSPVMIPYYMILAVVIVIAGIYIRDKIYHDNLLILLLDEKSTNTDYGQTGMLMIVMGFYSVLEYAGMFSNWKPDSSSLYWLILIVMPLTIYFMVRYFVRIKCYYWLKAEKKYRKIFELSEEEFNQKCKKMAVANQDKNLYPIINKFKDWRRLKALGESEPWYLEQWYGELTNEDMQFLNTILTQTDITNN